PGGGFRQGEPSGNQVLGELDPLIAEPSVGRVGGIVSEVLRDPPSRLHASEHRRTGEADEMPHLPGAAIVVLGPESTAEDAGRPAPRQVEERLPPATDPSGPLPKVEQELVFVVVGTSQLIR